MSTTYFIRSRGRVVGPFDPEHLRSMARRGQLSRLHELSEDGISWGAATNYPELFTGGQPADIASDPAPEAQSSPHAAASSSATAGAGWYIAKSGQQHGPLDLAALQAMALSSQLQPEDRVWSQGMSNWTPANQVPGLMFPPAGVQTVAEPQIDSTPSAPQDLPQSLARSALGARPWVIFLGVLLCVLAVVQTATGFASIVLGGRLHVSAVVMSGLLQIVGAIVFAAMGVLLLQYASRLGGLRYTSAPIVLEKALDSLRAFWILLSIYLIVLLSFVALFVLAAMATDWPGRPSPF